MQAAIEFDQRQTQIDAALTPRMAALLCLENKEAVVRELAQHRCINIIYATTHALLRRLKGGTDRPIVVVGMPLEEEHKEMPQSQCIAQAMQNQEIFVVRILTHLPFSLMGGQDKLWSHTITAMKRSILEN